MPNPTKTGSSCSPTANEPAQLARLCRSLAGFEARLQRCRREAESFLGEHWPEARHRGELAFLLGQMHSVIEHCRQLEARYRDERICLGTCEASGQDGRPGGSSAAAGG